jgi:RND family efflux transporter MFP subunit
MRTIATLALAAIAFGGGIAFKAWYDRRPAAAPAAKQERKILYWHDPMHPAYRSDKPGIAPDCGMQLEPVYADPAPVATDHSAHQSGGGTPEGAIHIPPDKQQLLNVKTGVAEVTSTSRTIRAAGKVALDETRVSHVHTKVEGWIDKVFVDYTGKPVERGQPLFTLYSPEMLATQQEFLLAIRGRERLAKSTLEGVEDHMGQMVESARRRLQLWDLTDAQIDEVARTGKPVRTITVYSPASGFVTERKAFPNVQAKPEMDLYTITDLGRVWILADVFEADAPSVQPGSMALIRLPFEAGRSLNGRVSQVLPQVDPTTRTLKARIEVDNPKTALKPEAWVDVEFRVYSGPQLTVPAEAVLDTGDHRRVFLDRGNGVFEPREVETGERLDGRVVVLRGLSPGDRIVVSGNFLIDSESQLRSGR